MNQIGARAWVVLTKSEDERSWSANTGYDDSVGRYYSYDSNVSRYRQVQAGDLVVIRVDDYVAGWSFIDDIEVIPNVTKEISRCPRCLKTNFRQRATMRPKNVCNACGSGFEDSERVTELKNVTAYRANYERNWVEAARPVGYDQLKEVSQTTETFNAIRPLDPAKMPGFLELVSGRSTAIKPDLILGDSAVILGGHTVGLTRRRIGQRKFRFSMMERFGENCAFSGPQPPQVLEAAHLYSFSERPTHQHDGGLLLRRDFHALFDAKLLAIHPKTWTIDVAPKIRDFQTYARLHGSEIHVPKNRRPSKELVSKHYEEALKVFG
ncbi:MAG: HNH endonuclease signature motif containing protein [Actinomycetota bacterium]|nr:HNH endonuclease signature motif containing protein [Actinomycetota bacterium]